MTSCHRVVIWCLRLHLCYVTCICDNRLKCACNVDLKYLFSCRGKTALAATIAIESDFPFIKIVSWFMYSLFLSCVYGLLYMSYFLAPNLVKFGNLVIFQDSQVQLKSYVSDNDLLADLRTWFLQVSAENMIGLQESTKCAMISKVHRMSW